jgi:hypothetical protein
MRAGGEMADTPVLGTGAFGRESSSLSWPTNYSLRNFRRKLSPVDLEPGQILSQTIRII